MTKIITKVKNNARGNLQRNVKAAIGWPSVLADIERDIRTLKSHRDIVRRKIERGEKWPGETAGTVVESAPAKG